MTLPAHLAIPKLGLTTLEACLFHLPLRYEDATQLTTLQQARQQPTDAPIQIEATVKSSEVLIRYKRQWLVVMVDDDDNELHLRHFNFYASQVNRIVIGQRLRVRGGLKLGRLGNPDEMVHPKMQRADVPLAQHLSPIYPAIAGVTQTRIQKVIRYALTQLPIVDTLSDAERLQYRLLDLTQSLRELHQPSPDANIVALQEGTHPAWQRLKFDELLAQQLSLRRARAARLLRSAPQLRGPPQLSAQLIAHLPFTLTLAQQRVWAEIQSDLQRPHPMQRLLQGDVGSGKTIVAALAAAQAIDSGYQAALMAPTEILAQQHFQKIVQWLLPLGVRISWLTGSQKKRDKEAAREAIQSGQTQLVIGTHALIQAGVQFTRLGLSVIDEQHRFGVQQRLALQSMNRNDDQLPHQLMMSATPIPRTLAMSYFADLDVSTIDELPPGRSPIQTRLVNVSRLTEIIGRLEADLEQGRQAYWVCPLIEESEHLDLTPVLARFEALQQALPERPMALLHGRLSANEKQQIMQSFVAGQLALLVSTTVIEVGVDVPNASVMVIENAERFGLSQLHQLRGRVGRGSASSVCLLLYQTPLSATAKARLRVMHETQDGFEIARQDLQLRGPGELLGPRQAGEAMLRFADLNDDHALLLFAQELAQQWLQQEHAEQSTASEQIERTNQHIERWLRGRLDFLTA